MLESLCRAAAFSTFLSMQEDCLLTGVALPQESGTAELHVENTWREHQGVVQAVLARLEELAPDLSDAGHAAVGEDGARIEDVFAAMLRRAA